MPRCTPLIAPVLLTAALGISTSSAGAATLFTSNTHTTRVSVGTTFQATSAGGIVTSSPFMSAATCTGDATLQLDVVENSDTRVSLTVTNGTFSGCDNATSGTFDWTITITGNGSVSGANTVYTTTQHNVRFDVAGHGFFSDTDRIGSADQPTVGTAPICLTPPTPGGLLLARIPQAFFDFKYCFIGSAAAWSLTN
jgi:hypothetical protein